MLTCTFYSWIFGKNTTIFKKYLLKYENLKTMFRSIVLLRYQFKGEKTISRYNFFKRKL